jgi:hypothetical protein
MEANLVGDGVAKPKRTFPYSNWGPWAAILGVIAALGVGIFLAVPALILGAQEGKIEARFPPTFTTSASFDKGDASAIALDPGTGRLYADHEDEVRVFGARGEEIPKAKITGLEDSQGLAVDGEAGTLYVAEQGPGRIVALAAGRGGAVHGAGASPQVAPIDASTLPRGLADFEPERIAALEGPRGGLYVLDVGDGQVLRFNRGGELRGHLIGPNAGDPFEFGSGDNDIAINTAGGRAPGRPGRCRVDDRPVHQHGAYQGCRRRRP